MKSIQEQLVEARLKEYTEAAKTSANVDKAALAIAALESVGLESNITVKRKKLLYTLSIALPPIGLVFGLWYFFSKKKIDGKQVGITCAVLTVFSFLIGWLVLSLFVRSLPTQTMDQVQNINPQDLNSLKDLLQ
jgi:hypothetical protein